jgi:filamentous hemagglutinin family protein
VIIWMAKLFRPTLSFRHTLVLSAAAFSALVSTRFAAGAPGVVLDGSLGTSGALPGPNYTITANMGRQVGSNLFQSFSSFNLTSAESATFTGPPQIRNILARVTGGSSSSIDGAINSDIAGANLFLLNPSGVIFGPHAQVNVTGSFVVSTANYVKLADGGKFNTSLGGNDSLTSAPVSAFGFVSPHPAAVQMNGTLLGVNPGQGLHVIAGNVTLNNTELDAPSGYLTLFSAASAGEVPFSLASPGSGFALATNPTFGNISLTNASYVDVDGAGGGKVVMRGGQLTVDNSTISSANYSSVRGGDIALQADQVAVQDGGEIITTADSTGNAGDISLQVGSLTLDGTGQASGSDTAILTGTANAGTGGSGSINVMATGAVNVLNGGNISASTAAPGGGITLQADSLDIDGTEDPSDVTGITYADGASDLGSAPSLSLDITGAVNVLGGGSIFSFAFGTETGPAISLQAGSLNIVGLSNDSSAIQTSTFGSGNAGAIGINVGGAMTLSTQGVVSSATSGSGTAGNISVHAGSLGLNNESNILSYSQPDNNAVNSGNAGNVTVNVDQAAVIQGGSLIGSYTNSLGDAGSVSVEADSLDLDGLGMTNLFTGISDQSGTDALGNAGFVTVTVLSALTIEDGGAIGSNTFSVGNGSDVNVLAGSLAINGDGINGVTGILANANTGATGNGGSVNVQVEGQAIITGGGSISTTTFSSGNSGSLVLNVTGDLSVVDGGEIAGGTFSSGGSGAIFVHASNLYIDSMGYANSLTGISDQSGPGATGNAGPLTVNVDNSLVLADGGEISSGTRSTGNGGDVLVQAGSLAIENAAGVSHLTGITSETDGTTDSQGNLTGQGGDAGSVTVDVSGALVITSGKIDTDTFCSGSAGNVTIRAGTLSIDGSANPEALTGIYSDSDGYAGDYADAGGNAGTVSVYVGGALDLTGGGKIAAATLTAGLGGDVDVQAGSVSIDGLSSGVTAQSLGLGDSGNVTIGADSVALTNRGTITTSSLYTNAGSIVVNASDRLTEEGGSSITTQAAVNGGDITLNVGTLVYLLDSEITAAAGNNGGNILIDPEFVVLNNSLISANAAAGQGGNITIISDYFLNSGSTITATGTTNDGTITITAPDFDLANNLLSLPGNLVQAEKELRERCADSLNHEFSSFIVVGRGGVETAPDELQPDFGGDALAVLPNREQ